MTGISPTEDQIFDAIDATWAPYATTRLDDWLVREGRGGGSRVSSASFAGMASKDADIDVVEKAQSALSQPSQVMLRPGQPELDARLEARGYQVVTPVRILCAPTSVLSADSELGTTVVPSDKILASQKDLWAQGGIGPARIAIMNRVRETKTALLARRGHDLAGVAFIALHRNLAMLHALDVPMQLRRQGMGRKITAAAADWARMNGADHLALLVVRDNLAANRLYEGMGMTEIASYHYRLLRE